MAYTPDDVLVAPPNPEAIAHDPIAGPSAPAYAEHEWERQQAWYLDREWDEQVAAIVTLLSASPRWQARKPTPGKGSAGGLAHNVLFEDDRLWAMVNAAFRWCEDRHPDADPADYLYYILEAILNKSGWRERVNYPEAVLIPLVDEPLDENGLTETDRKAKREYTLGLRALYAQGVKPVRYETWPDNEDIPEYLRGKAKPVYWSWDPPDKLAGSGWDDMRPLGVIYDEFEERKKGLVAKETRGPVRALYQPEINPSLNVWERNRWTIIPWDREEDEGTTPAGRNASGVPALGFSGGSASSASAVASPLPSYDYLEKKAEREAREALTHQTPTTLAVNERKQEVLAILPTVFVRYVGDNHEYVDDNVANGSSRVGLGFNEWLARSREIGISKRTFRRYKEVYEQDLAIAKLPSGRYARLELING